MTKHQYLHLTHQITQLHHDMRLDFTIIAALIGVMGILTMLVMLASSD